MSPAPQVLVVGLDPRRVGGSWDPEPVVAAIEEGMARFAGRGVGARSCLVGLDGTDDIEEVITDALRSEHWACVVVGGGIRKPEELLELFETVVNLVRIHAPQAAIAFNAGPTDSLEAALRWLPDPSTADADRPQ